MGAGLRRFFCVSTPKLWQKLRKDLAQVLPDFFCSLGGFFCSGRGQNTAHELQRRFLTDAGPVWLALGFRV